ncbi:hypothetical protein [Streptomyces sp. NPDC094032]|uniref:hypothetical protein n=1 Tax=Streptomyces sp. NPDC094032 TaxID=3155308 RepID=UPI0033186851
MIDRLIRPTWAEPLPVDGSDQGLADALREADGEDGTKVAALVAGEAPGATCAP